MKNSQVFDPTALERAAAAVRELNQSPHAAKALEAMIKAEEAKRADRQATLKQAEINRVRAEGEERRQTIDHQKKLNMEIAEHNDKLERQRLKDKIREQEISAQRMREESEESVKRQEEIRRETMRQQLQKQYEMDEKKIILQSKLNQENYRKNFDLIQRENELKSSIDAQTRKDIHTLYLSKFKEGFQYLQQNPQGLYTVGKGALYISAAYFLSKYSLSLFFRRLEAYIATPSLVRETSRKSLKWMMPSSGKIFERIVLNENLKQTLQLVTAGLIAKQQQAAPLRNFLFYGLPGTGKTMFAKLLAYNSGLHFAVITGGDIEKLGDKAVPEIDKLFQWCQSTPKGTLIFIDEAEAIFYKRSQMKQTTSALSTFLAQTSAASSKFSLILATNLPNKLDEAILDRIDQIIQFDYLKVDQRFELLKKGFEEMKFKRNVSEYILNPTKLFWKNIQAEFNINDDELKVLAEKLVDFSPRQIDKFILSVHDAAIGQCVIDQKNHMIVDITFVNNILNEAIAQNICRKQWSI